MYGCNSADSYTPGATLELRRQETNGTETVIFSGPLVPWDSGEVHAQSGDRVWWFDFSDVTTDGTYRIHDPASVFGHDNTSPPSADLYPRYYGPVSTEATAAGAAAFDLGATVYESVGLHEYAEMWANGFQTLG